MTFYPDSNARIVATVSHDERRIELTDAERHFFDAPEARDMRRMMTTNTARFI
jgi:hypothetical protein